MITFILLSEDGFLRVRSGTAFLSTLLLPLSLRNGGGSHFLLPQNIFLLIKLNITNPNCFCLAGSKNLGMSEMSLKK